MASMDSVIQMILETKSVVQYLEQKGHIPVKTLPGKLLYNCPMPDHNEEKPSFVVFTNGQFENFYCFGCMAKYHIIHLVARLESISYREAIIRLSNGMEITEYDETLFLKSKWNKIFEASMSREVTESLLLISDYCRLYLESVNHDKDEVDLVDKYLKSIDQCVLSFDFDTINDNPTILRDKLKSRRSWFEQRKKERLREAYRNENAIG